MFNYQEYRVFLACGATDMRKNINGLYDVVANNFELDVTQKAIFAFCNRQHNRIKLLVWEENGFWMHMKRLEKGTLIWPETAEDEKTMNLTVAELESLIQSPGIKQKIKRIQVWK